MSMKTKRRKRFKLSGRLKGICHSNLLQQRRETIYKMLSKKTENEGKVPCFFCGRHVDEIDATLEHITPLSLGGDDSMDNLAISHDLCNHVRSNMVDLPTVKDENISNTLESKDE